jgi:DNA-binding MarR family transcriptional regulator
MATSCSEAQWNRQMNQMSGGPKFGFTPTQGQYLAFIDAYTRVNLRPPAEADIQRRFGVTPPSVHQMVLALEREGLIRRKPRASRSIEVLVPPEGLPVLEMPDQLVKFSVPRY